MQPSDHFEKAHMPPREEEEEDSHGIPGVPAHYRWRGSGRCRLVLETDLCFLLDTGHAADGRDRRPNLFLLVNTKGETCAIQSRCPGCDNNMVVDLVARHVVCHRHNIAFCPSTGAVCWSRDDSPPPNLTAEVFHVRVGSDWTETKILHPHYIFHN